MSENLQLSPEDSRDYTVATVLQADVDLPDSYLPIKELIVTNQWASSQCMVHAATTCLSYCQQKQGNEEVTRFSPGHLYANREPEDMNVAGMYPRKALKVLQKEGVCPYYTFRWGASPLPVTTREFIKAGEEYLASKAKEYCPTLNYFRIQNYEELKQSIFQNGAAIVSMPVFQTFGSHITVPKEGKKEKGRHAVCAIGWTEGDEIICQDSYSSLRGDGGKIYVSKEFIETQAVELWGIQLTDEVPVYKPTVFERTIGSFWHTIKWIATDLAYYICGGYEDEKAKEEQKAEKSNEKKE